ncbi:hypothetical protein BOTBODRAFT_58178 [Botryobasidium botryosum FD-172 SS1]|uniref:AB hydrolase-1 domain-containing protein n=1 Tax=Botryobasidium botryosum (strain FD-172 SS1) TaxID=930990 RepID=A0A067M3X6_BOTB1|nr:hypothetical protein BOTBODRAFT_58178 [Botryobasidium botryosum FD-172 SS1]
MPVLAISPAIALSYRLSLAPAPGSPTILFLAGLFQRAGVQFDPQFSDDRFAKNFNLVAIDVHGHGDTTGRDEDWTMADNARDVGKAMRKLGFEKYFVYGSAQGGIIALHMALVAPSNVLGLVIQCSTASRPPPSVSQWFRRAVLPRFTSSPIPDETIEYIEIVNVGSTGEEADAEVGAELMKKMRATWREHSGNRKTTQAVEAVLRRPSLLEHLCKIHAPALILHGTIDPSFPIQEAEMMYSGLPVNPLNRLVVIDAGLTHLINVSKELCEQVNITVVSWIKEVQADLP